ncbi:hypothetical protein RZS08_06965, partial [Arthrospira platensis SPKY1]|nr:hypothetical protein [Arthrospira platensis SPKY1]
LEVIKNSIAFNLIDSIFYLNKKSSDKNKKKVEENKKENKEEYKPFNNSILLSRVYNKEKLEEIILKKKDYTDKTIYDITEQLKENIEKESKLRKVIIYEISSSQRLTYDQLLEHWFIEKLLELNVIKNEQNKINKIIFLTETSFNYIKERLSNKYKLKSVKKVYRQVINIIYKNDKDSIDKLISLNSNTTRIYNSYRDYKIIRNNSIIFSYLEIYCILGQIEKILTEEQIKVY